MSRIQEKPITVRAANKEPIETVHSSDTNYPDSLLASTFIEIIKEVEKEFRGVEERTEVE